MLTATLCSDVCKVGCAVTGRTDITQCRHGCARMPPAIAREAEAKRQQCARSCASPVWAAALEMLENMAHCLGVLVATVRANASARICLGLASTGPRVVSRVSHAVGTLRASRRRSRHGSGSECLEYRDSRDRSCAPKTLQNRERRSAQQPSHCCDVLCQAASCHG
jgi:hypothetical protein